MFILIFKIVGILYEINRSGSAIEAFSALEEPQAMETPRTVERGTLPTSSPVYLNIGGLQNALPRLQIIDSSSQSKPDNYRISPITPQTTQDSSTSDITLVSSSVTQTKTDLDLVLEDWSGRGAHVDFQPKEQVPLTEDRFLGQGSMGAVYETTIRGHAFAWKRRFCRHHIGDDERKELEILKKVSHHHIIRLAGSYTHQHFLGLLLYPVAYYDLATLLEETEAVINNTDLSPLQYERITTFCEVSDIRFDDPKDYDQYAYSYSLHCMKGFLVPFVKSKIGCIVSAVEYLHSQRIRHKDLKPSNILLSREGLWLTDFGTATDFSLQTISRTENWERGTPKYFAPEVASYQPSGRAADIFSLGCVVLEMYMTIQVDMAEKLRDLRSARDKSFQANLDPVLRWLYSLSWSSGEMDPWTWDHTGTSIRREISRMLALEPDQRPSIAEVHTNLALIDTLEVRRDGLRYFEDCCRKPFISGEDHDKIMIEMAQAHQTEVEALKAEHASKIEEMRVSLAAQAEKEKEDLIRNYDLEITNLQTKILAFQGTMGGGTPISANITCRLCFKSLSTEDELSQHREYYHPTASSSTVSEPLDNTTSEQRFQQYPSMANALSHRCDVCKWTTHSRRALQRHMDKQHVAPNRASLQANSGKYMV